MLSDLSLQSLKPTGKQYIVWDVPNFGVRVSQSGTKAFIAQVGDQRRKVTIGRYPSMSLKDARKKAQKLLLSDEPAPESVTLATALDTYRDTHLAQYKGTNKRDTTHLLYKYLAPVLRRQIRTITARDITDILDPMTPSMHNHMFGVFRTFFNWCDRRDYAPNPIAKMRKPFKETSRARVLSPEELTRVWVAAGAMGHFGFIVRACIITGQRRGEIAQTRSDWPQGSQLVIPASVAKNGREHSIYCSPLARELLMKISDCNLVFSNWSKSKAALDTLAGVRGWVIHDLRRTAASMMASLGIQPHIIERILNHTAPVSAGGAIAAIYNRHTYQAEMREALEKYEQHLRTVLQLSTT